MSAPFHDSRYVPRRYRVRSDPTIYGGQPFVELQPYNTEATVIVSRAMLAQFAAALHVPDNPPWVPVTVGMMTANDCVCGGGSAGRVNLFGCPVHGDT